MGKWGWGGATAGGAALCRAKVGFFSLRGKNWGQKAGKGWGKARRGGLLPGLSRGGAAATPQAPRYHPAITPQLNCGERWSADGPRLGGRSGARGSAGGAGRGSRGRRAGRRLGGGAQLGGGSAARRTGRVRARSSGAGPGGAWRGAWRGAWPEGRFRGEGRCLHGRSSPSGAGVGP